MSTASQPRQPRINLTAETSVEAVPEAEEKPAAAQPSNQGLAGFARQGDIVELHKRIGEKFARLPQEIATQIAAPQAAASARMDKIEARLDTLSTSLDGLEGALRIELAPYLSMAVAEAVRAQAPQHRRRSALWLPMALLVGLVGGAVFHAPLARYAAEAEAALSPYLVAVTGR